MGEAKDIDENVKGEGQKPVFGDASITHVLCNEGAHAPKAGTRVNIVGWLSQP